MFGTISMPAPAAAFAEESEEAVPNTLGGGLEELFCYE
jgi:hypothetical protein